MRKLLLYGLNAAGETVFTETLTRSPVADLRAEARARLERCQAVEIWEGPLCVVRLRRDGEAST